MSHLDVIWVLPHRDQADDEDVVKNGRPAKLTVALAVQDLPKELIIGIPESVLQGRHKQEVLLAQYVRQRSHARALFALSTPCGKDKGGRTVYLTLIEVLPTDGLPERSPSLEGLSGPELSKAQQILSRLAFCVDPWSRRIHDMLEAVSRHGEIDTFCSTTVPNAAYPAQWTPKKKSPRPYGRSRGNGAIPAHSGRHDPEELPLASESRATWGLCGG